MGLLVSFKVQEGFIELPELTKSQTAVYDMFFKCSFLICICEVFNHGPFFLRIITVLWRNSIVNLHV